MNSSQNANQSSAIKKGNFKSNLKQKILFTIGIIFLAISSVYLGYFMVNHEIITDCNSENCLGPLIVYFGFGFIALIIGSLFIIFSYKKIVSCLLAIVIMAIFSVSSYFILPKITGLDELKRDEIRAHDLFSIRSNLSDYFSEKQAYPQTLEELSNPGVFGYKYSLNDPKNKEPYFYIFLKNANTYKLCIKRESSIKNGSIDYQFENPIDSVGNIPCYGPNPGDKNYFK